MSRRFRYQFPFRSASGKSWKRPVCFPLALLLALFVAGCDSGGERGAESDGLATYPHPPVQADTPISGYQPSTAGSASWTNADFAVLRTELSPAFLLRSKSSYLSLFQELTKTGLEPPSHVAFSSRAGPRSFSRGQPMPVVGMEENWLIAWFCDAKGWEQFDVPWAIFLQHQPTAMILDEDGLQLQFRQGAGDVVMMPLYGYAKLPPTNNNFKVVYGLEEDPVDTGLWKEVLTTDLLMRIRYWASASRQFPLYCRETFKVGPGTDALTIRHSFQWHPIEDDWETRPIRVASVSPPLALGMTDGIFPATLSERYMNHFLSTPIGPYIGVENKDVYEARLDVLPYIHLTERIGVSPTNQLVSVKDARSELGNLLEEFFTDDEQAVASLSQASLRGFRAVTRAVPYLEDPIRTKAHTIVGKTLLEHVLQPSRFRKITGNPNFQGDFSLYAGVDNSSADMENLSQQETENHRLLEILWLHAHYSGDWRLMEKEWDRIKSLFTVALRNDWAGFGQRGVKSSGSGAIASMATARMAYRMGDLETYHYACYLFARELAHEYLRLQGEDYFRQQQPWNSLDPMPESVQVKSLDGPGLGWLVEPAVDDEESGMEDSVNDDMARFYRDYISRNFLRKRMQGISSEKSGASVFEKLNQHLNVLNTAPSGEMERLIAPPKDSRFMIGLERHVRNPQPILTQVINRMAGEAWPSIRWWKPWLTEKGMPWSFGSIIPRHSDSGLTMEEVPLNWNTSVLVFNE